MDSKVPTQMQGNGAQSWGPQDDDRKYLTGRQLIAVMASVLLGILLAALDQTIVGPALPRIIGDLGGFDHYSWVVTIYLLTSTITVPIFGKLSDMYGRKWFYVAGIVIFMLGSALSGLSANMLELIIFRGIQGLGGGILFALAFAIIADVIPPADRGKWQGAFGSVFGLSSVIGPTVGGYLTDNVGWQWVFYVNVPVGLVALAVLIFAFPAEVRHHVKKVIDWLGVGTLVAGLTPLLLALSLGGTKDWEWGSPQVLGLLAMAAVFLVAFVFVESRAKEPIIPLDLFKSSIFTVSVITVFLTGVGLFGAILYIPLFIQAIQGDSATNSGNAVTPMTMAIVLSSIITGQIISRTGKYRIIGIIGMSLVTIGMVLLYTMNMDTPRFTTITYMIVMGAGLGIAFPLYTLVVQNSFPIQRVGVVTAAVTFFRSMGSTVGVALLGTVDNSQFHDNLGPELRKEVDKLPPQVASQIPVDQLASGLSNVNPQALVSAEGLARLQAQLLEVGVPQAAITNVIDLITRAMRPALFGGIQQAFLIGAILLGIGLVTTVFLKELPLRKSNRPVSMGIAEGGGEGLEIAAAKSGKEMAASGMPGGTMVPAREEVRVARE
ncbi:MAG TPA: MDR family MFS transporter [Chloroflexia bacterium]|nr:MDR family MFS transporter [Chloroflexia bacterium]